MSTTEMNSLERLETILLKEGAVKPYIDAICIAWVKNALKMDFNDIKHDVQAMLKETQTGSVLDGTYSARMFSEEYLTIEFDFLFEVAKISEDMVDQVSGKPGFYQTKQEYNILQNVIKLGEFFSKTAKAKQAMVNATMKALAANKGLSLGHIVKEVAGKTLLLSDGEYIKDQAAQCFHVDRDRVSCDMVAEMNGPAETQFVRLCIDGKHKITVIYDLVIGIRLDFWPHEADKWGHRERKWPPADLVDQVIREHAMQLVAKPSKETEQETTDDWRLTFSTEKLLIKHQSPEMRFTFYVFKVLFYRYFGVFKVQRNGKEKIISSYLAKTTMHWMCEEVDPTIWKKDSESITRNVQMLLTKLFGYLDAGHLPNYFIPEINLLSSIPEELLQQVAAMDRAKLVEDPIGCLPTCFELVNERLDECIFFCKEIAKIQMKEFQEDTD